MSGQAVSGQAVSVSGLLALLDAVGARLTLDGDGLALSGKRPPVALLDAVRIRRAEVLAHLKGVHTTDTLPAAPARIEATGGHDLALDASTSPISTGGHGPPRPEWAAEAARPGRCGSCARFELAPDWGAHMGTCGCPASGWPDNTAPLAIHEGHRCAAYRGDGEEEGRGYRARASGKRSSPPPLPPGPLESGAQPGMVAP